LPFPDILTEKEKSAAELDITIFHRLCIADQEETKKQLSTENKLKLLANKKVVWPSLFQAVQKCLTIGVSTATLEAAFSTLTRVIRPTRLSMSSERKFHLTILSHHNKILQGCDLEKFVDLFRDKQNRRLTF
jgi:hypothetical protein